MRQLINTSDYNVTINLAKNMDDNIEYHSPVLFHCYWNGTLNEKHFYSIKSCYYFNVYKNKNNKIILWLENNIPNNFNEEIEKYAEIRQFSLKNEISFLENRSIKYNENILTYYSDFIRCVLLHNYGGCWFDLDCFFLRKFDPIFCQYENDICLYQWENENYPNNAIFISLIPKSNKMKTIIEFIIHRNRGWGFQESQLTYDLPIDLLVLPCSWFDGDWIVNPYVKESFNYDCSVQLNLFFIDTDKKINFDNFHKGSFCYHWHNQWNKPIGDKSIIKQLINIIDISMV
jgi:hypothetical protein